MGIFHKHKLEIGRDGKDAIIGWQNEKNKISQRVRTSLPIKKSTSFDGLNLSSQLPLLFFIVRSTNFSPLATLSLQNGCCAWGEASRDRQAAVPRLEVALDGFLKNYFIFLELFFIFILQSFFCEFLD
jgi:hypothetical protein